MTYCVAHKLKDGLIFCSDSRTNAGVDHVSVFCKMHLFDQGEHRKMVLLNAGNLATTQEVISKLRRNIQSDHGDHLYNVNSMFDVARLVGEQVREVLDRMPESKSDGVDFRCTFLVGGQINQEEPRLFLVYAEGNFIEATVETPFFQIGESKYGKPILDRVIDYHTSMDDAVKCTLISFDSTMRSNLSVGLPIDIYILPHLQPDKIQRYSIGENDPSFIEIRKHWGEGLRQVFAQIPNPEWLKSLN